ncbi:glycerophosphodiester phosphodiesterase [Rhizobium sp. KVB221]|uniref:Glycerophosphodiester phosphodiesterase n=1 Tax=Rhizobium setariae TaxID=2801340 RepID=A0A936YM40_9HYPH|nr:glycerophosphodiester phosphodiesterase family protein [Rhizobium setariae]MBL0373019.1 glycerophosphodiester phosphodiesterase [Rhizobium setariae]
MRDMAFLTSRPIAHRGLHDGNKAVWENTLSAFERAIEAGFAIECDLQYAADAVPVVFHDDDMKRLCNIGADIRTKTSAELSLTSVGGTKDKVASLKVLLRLVKGRVPLVLELKGRDGDDEGFASSVLEVLEDYDGDVALMSFDTWLLKELKELESPFPVGLTAEGREEGQFRGHREAMAWGLDFISYSISDLPNAFIASERERGIPVITWTVRSPKQAAHSAANADQITFEGFDPRHSETGL